MSATEQEIGSVLAILSRVDDAGQMARIRSALTSRTEAISRMNIQRLRPGMRVSWTGKYGPAVGTVERVKQKWVEVRQDKQPGEILGKGWNVTAGALTEVKP